MGQLEGFGIFDSVPVPTRETPTNVNVEYWRRKVDRPSYEILVQEIKQLGFAGTGRKYRVSDNAVRKWLRHYKNMTTGIAV